MDPPLDPSPASDTSGQPEAPSNVSDCPDTVSNKLKNLTLVPHDKPVTDTPLTAPLENLPPEIRREILSTLRYEELRSLVHASPTFHQQYAVDRKFLLGAALQNTLRSVTVDACAAYRSSLESFFAAVREEEAPKLLNSYMNRRSSPGYSISDEGFTEDETVGMAAFYATIIKPLAQYFTTWMFRFLSGDYIEDGSDNDVMSPTEETRILRALYRFQLCGNLFGSGDRPLDRLVPSEFDDLEILAGFLCAFEPWETEEITCIYSFAKEVYRDLFWSISEYVDFDLESRYDRFHLMEGTISRGPALLHTVCFNTKPHDDKDFVAEMTDRIAWDTGHGLLSALSESSQAERRRDFPSERDQKQFRRDPLPFRGDRNPDDPDADGLYPPLAWTWMWKGTYSNLYGAYIANDIRWSGYVFWDAARLEGTEVGRCVARQWEHDDDPRDDVDADPERDTDMYDGMYVRV